MRPFTRLPFGATRAVLGSPMPRDTARLLQTLYRKCLKTSRQWTDAEHTFAIVMHELDAFLRPSFKQHLLATVGTQFPGPPISDISELAELISVTVIIRNAFEYSLPSDSDKVHSWCVQAAFAFIRRCQRKQEERYLAAHWAHVAEPTFTPLDASLVAAYCHYFHNAGRRQFGSALGGGLGRSLEDVMRQQVISRTVDRKSLNAFTEGVLIQVEALVEQCRSAIPPQELLRPELHGKLIARTVLHTLRFDYGLRVVGDSCEADLHCLDVVLHSKQGSPWVVGSLLTHILASLGLRSVVLCSTNLPLVCVYGKSKSRLQFCVDVVGTRLLDSSESMALFRAAAATFKGDVTTTDADILSTDSVEAAQDRFQVREGKKLAITLLHRSSSCYAQAGFVLGLVLADTNLPVEEHNSLATAKTFVRKLQNRRH